MPPLYTRFTDVYDAVDRLVTLVERGDHREVDERPLGVTCLERHDRVDLHVGALRQRGHADRHAGGRVPPSKNEPYASFTRAKSLMSVR